MNNENRHRGRMGWLILPPAAALRPDRLAFEAGRQAIHGLT
ncbi:MAG: hypothetical protein V2J11_00725 [Desulfofustis sp.]|jgi:hypothetical protein|nr:hypothetical protein [Desulfofustis sp.]